MTRCDVNSTKERIWFAQMMLPCTSLGEVEFAVADRRRKRHISLTNPCQVVSIFVSLSGAKNTFNDSGHNSTFELSPLGSSEDRLNDRGSQVFLSAEKWPFVWRTEGSQCLWWRCTVLKSRTMADSSATRSSAIQRRLSPFLSDGKGRQSCHSIQQVADLKCHCRRQSL